MTRRIVLLVMLGLLGCDTGIVTEDGTFLVDLGLQMEARQESSPLAVAAGSVVCPEVVAQASGGEFSSISGNCVSVGQGCEVLQTPGFVDYVVENTGGCASAADRDAFALDVVPWNALEVHLESPYDEAFAAVLTTEEGGALDVPPLHVGGVVTVVQGGVVSVRGVPRRGTDFVAYDGTTTHLDVGTPKVDGSATVTAADVGPIEVVTPAGRRALGTVTAVPIEAVASLEFVAGWTEDAELGPYVYALRVVARDGSGAVLQGAPVTWSVPRGHDVAIEATEGTDYVVLTGGCEAYRDTAGLRDSVVRASLGAVEVELPVVWKEAGFLGEPSAWAPNDACVRSEHPPRAMKGCGCSSGPDAGLGWTLLGVLLALLRRRSC